MPISFNSTKGWLTARKKLQTDRAAGRRRQRSEERAGWNPELPQWAKTLPVANRLLFSIAFPGKRQRESREGAKEAKVKRRLLFRGVRLRLLHERRET